MIDPFVIPRDHALLTIHHHHTLDGFFDRDRPNGIAMAAHLEATHGCMGIPKGYLGHREVEQLFQIHGLEHPEGFGGE